MKKYLAIGSKFIILGLASAFEMFESYTFFTFIMPPEKYFLAFLGFGLTTPAMFAYMLLFKFEPKPTSMKKTISLAMMIICVIGGVLTAGFGVTLEGMAKSGYTFNQEDIDFMAFAISVLIAVHCLAMIAYFTGDEIIKAFGDEDGDGIPNIVDRHDNRRPAMASETETPRPTKPQQGRE